MPRPKLQSDDAIIDAAQAALLERGAVDFTLSDVAERVGLSRAAVIQRFGNKDSLLRLIAHREVELTKEYLASFALERSWDGLEAFLRIIIESMGPGQDFAIRAQLAWAEAVDPELRRLAGQRYGMVQAAIADRLPETGRPAMEIARHIHGVIAGATMQWLADDHDDLSAYVLERVRLALALLRQD